MEKTECCISLEELKQDYEKLQEKYHLPEFQELAEDFDIEKAQERKTSFLLREIRIIMNDKLTSYAQLFENLINPSSSSILIFTILKVTDEKDKEQIKEIYKKLSKIQIKIITLDTIYNEENEADFIKQVFAQWQVIKKDINNLLEKFEKNFDLNNTPAKRGYFG